MGNTSVVQSILVLEDRPAIADEVKTALEKQGYGVTVMSDVIAGLNAIHTTRPEMLILALSLNGAIELLQKLHTEPRPPRLPVIAICPMQVDVFELWRLGVDACLTVPFNPQELVIYARRIFKSIDEDLALAKLDFAGLFAKWLAEPLQSVIGQSLKSVVYYALAYEYPYFDVDDPNDSGGCQGIHLVFEAGELELDWDWQQIFRAAADDFVSPPIVYHLVARSTSQRRPTVSVPTEDDCSGLAVLDAMEAKIWKRVVGEPLVGGKVWGVALPGERYSPQAVELQFPSGQAVIAVGMTADMSMGDGDEMLVFSEAEWKQRLSEPAASLIEIWSARNAGA